MVVSDVMNQALRGCDSMASPKIWFNWTCLSGSFACPVFSPRRSSAFQLDWTSTRSMLSPSGRRASRRQPWVVTFRSR